MSELTIRPFRQGDEAGIVELHNRVFRTKTTNSAWRWKFREVDDSQPIVWLAETGGRIIGQYAGVPTRFQLGRRAAQALQGADAMVDPDFRRKGVMLKLIESAHPAWKGAGYEFAYGLPIQSWGTRVVSFSPEIFCTLAWFSRPLRPTRMLSDRTRGFLPTIGLLDRLWNRPWDYAPRFDGIEIDHVLHAGDAFDRLWQSISPDLRNSVVRDADRIKHRYLTHPDIRYAVYLARREGEPAGYFVIRLADVPAGRVGYLVEWFSRPGDLSMRQALIRFGIDTIRASGAVSVHAICGHDSADVSLLKKAGLVFSPGNYELRFAHLSDRFSPGSPADWDFQGGDFDVL